MLENMGNIESKEENVNDEKKVRYLKDSLIISACFAFFIGVFAPAEFYFSNSFDVWYDLYDIMPILIFCSIVMFAVLALGGVITSKKKKVNTIYNICITVLAICLYVQGTFIEVPYGELNGEAIAWENYTAYNASSVSVWVGVIIMVIAFCFIVSLKKIEDILKVIIICIVIVQVISGIIVGVTTGGFSKKNGYRTISEGKWDYSRNKNFFVLILDTYDSRSFEDFMLQNREELVSQTFEDFIFYRDTMGAFNLTDYALPQIITGVSYKGEESYGDYIEDSYMKSPLLNRLHGEGWKILLHTGTRMPKNEGKDYISNLARVDLKVVKWMHMTNGIYRMVMFKYFPTPIKKYVYYDTQLLGSDWTVKEIEGVDLSAYDDLQWDPGIDTWDNNCFYWNQERISCDEEQNIFQMYHLKGIHALRDLDGNLNVIDDMEHMYSLEAEAGVVMFIVHSWIDKLKEDGIYDNSVIVIMADHGASSYPDPENFTQCPIFMIKGFDEKHEFQVSDIPVSYEDLQDIYDALLDGESGVDVMKKALSKDGVDAEGYDLYDAFELTERLRYQDHDYEKVGRTRKMIFHDFVGNLGADSRGSEGYELYTDYPVYWGGGVQSTGVVY